MQQNTNHQTAKFIHSQQEVSSEVQKHAISLGIALVKTLELDPGSDTLSRWMSHYIAEQISLSESTTGDDKKEAELRCFETILKLWSRRQSLPNDGYPFRKFEPIFRTLNQISIDSQPAYYFRPSSSYSPQGNSKISTSDTDDVQSWIDIVLAVDGAAKVLIQTAFEQAAYHAADEESAEWIEQASKVLTKEVDDISIVVKLIGETDQNDEKKALREEEKSLQAKIEKLNAFAEISSEMQEILTKELQKVSQKLASTN